MQLVRARSRRLALVTRTTTSLALCVGLGLGVAPALAPASAAPRHSGDSSTCLWPRTPMGHPAPGFRCSIPTL